MADRSIMLDEHDRSLTKYELTENRKNGKELTPIVVTKTSSDKRADYDRVHTLRNALPQILATCAKNLLLLTYGTTLGISTIALPALDADRRPNATDPNRELKLDIISLSRTEISWFSSINLICVPLGCFVSGAFTQPLGRRRSMKLLTIPFFLVWVLYYYSRSVVTLYLALVISGLAGGLHEAPVLTYVAEITEPYLRGMLSSTAPTTVIVGTVSQLVLGRFYHWRTVVLINMCFPVLAFIALNFVPESPHWLISKGRYEEAEKSLCWLRGWVHPDEVQHELSILKKYIQTKGSAQKISFKESLRRYTLRSFIVPHFIVLIIFFVGQFGGMMSLQTNAVQLFQRLGTKEVDEYTATLIFGVVEFVGSVTCVGLVHLTGKRKLLITATGISTVCLFTLAAYDYFHQFETVDQSYLSHYRWIPIVFLNANAFFTHAGIRLLAWVLIGEIYPTSIRATATGVSALWFYVFAFVANKNFGWMLQALNLYGLLGLYGSVLLFGSVFFYIFVPETEGLELFAIEKHFERKGNIFRTKIKADLVNDEEEVMNGDKLAAAGREV